MRQFKSDVQSENWPQLRTIDNESRTADHQIMAILLQALLHVPYNNTVVLSLLKYFALLQTLE